MAQEFPSVSRLSDTSGAQKVRTLDRILSAAIVQFSRRAYEEVGLRGIAAAAGVDVAHVHWSFGSKERLFTEAVRRATTVDRVVSTAGCDLPRSLARQILLPAGGRPPAEIGQLEIVIRSLSCVTAGPLLRDFIPEALIEPLSEQIGDPDARRASLVAALLAGVSILRNVLKAQPLCGADEGALEALIADTIDHIVRAHPGELRPDIITRGA
ncbi:TetR/AcrR family transcriptional regulator [Pseudoroseomonas ludipueritiae]|uniref:TetR family transcriptional regulator n=1 Tax=Pseudoroseomonas ludipueritiae TaxID=198093 RepID=A0ABR7R4Z9_9PROT|nr:TetR/AcrR family transcriptional regulator [Pseudoroseomonas ludipueritiae]MBC9176808.1 TetR family transcriptional regulator [Pseudoroseomonas ludipueritiae]